MQNKTEGTVYAGFFVRLAAYLFDSLLVGMALLFVRLPLWISSLVNPENLVVRNIIFQYSIADIVIYILGVLYFILMTYFSGATLGKKVFHIKVESVQDRKMTLIEVIFRETVGRFLSSLIVNVGYLMIGVSSEKTGLHDRLSDTRVVYRHVKQEVVQTPVAYDKEQTVRQQPYTYVPITYETHKEEDIVEDVSVEQIEE